MSTETPQNRANELCLVEASIADLQQALTSGAVTSVKLVSLYLRRIDKYDSHGPLLNSVIIINPHVFAEAAASDAYRAAGHPLRPLEGIPYTVKDSYKVRNLTVASGSPAFRKLIATDDAFTVARLRDAGAVLIGKTNMPPMAAGGMQRGVYGRAESPYNADYLTAAFASGSSNGSATSTAASFAAFGMAEETVSSGRSPASNNGLVAYTPSRGIISIRGNWPLYTTCDVIVPHTRTVEDLFAVLDVIVAEDHITEGDFWRQQQVVQLPKLSTLKPASYRDIAKNKTPLKGKRIGVPRMYIGQDEPDSKHVYTRQSVIDLFNAARKDLESYGATVVETDFPLLTNFERESYPGQTVNVPNLPKDWPSIERREMIAYAWDDFLMSNADPSHPRLSSIDSQQIFPRPPASLVDKYNEVGNAIKYHELVNYIAPNRTSIFQLPGLSDALNALDSARKADLEIWLDTNNLDFLVFPANGDVGRADADRDPDSARHAWQNGVKYSNGNRALRHLGVPTVSVCMGIMSDTQMPVGLTFAGKAYDDVDLLSYAYEYERVSKRRKAPRRTPVLDSDRVGLKVGNITNKIGGPVPDFTIATDVVDGKLLRLSGQVTAGAHISIYVDGESVENVQIEDGVWKARAELRPISSESRIENGGTVVVWQTMVVAVASGENGRTVGRLLLL